MPKRKQPRSVRQYLEENNVTQSALAARLKIRPSHLSMILRGTRRPSLTVLARLSKETGVSVDLLLASLVGRALA